MGGAVARKLLGTTHGVQIVGHALRIGDVELGRETNFDELLVAEGNAVRCADPDKAKEMIAAIEAASEEGDSLGGIVQVVARGVPAGVGEPVFDKLDAEIAKALTSIGSVKGIEFGEGFRLAGMRGSEANDPIVSSAGAPKLLTNHAGGILGGISTGNDIVVNFAVKPTPSISDVQRTVDMISMADVEIKISGRHDPCIVPRVVAVGESMIAIVLADLMIRGGQIRAGKL
jgi:chorismate synthase